MTASATHPAYRVKGTTGDITTCDRCGREELRRTVIMAALDADGNEEDILHMGVDCAARAAKMRQADITKAARSADEQAREAAAREREAARRAEHAAYRQWLVGIGIDLKAWDYDPWKALAGTPYTRPIEAYGAFRATYSG